jgi:hypothetical protein
MTISLHFYIPGLTMSALQNQSQLSEIPIPEELLHKILSFSLVLSEDAFSGHDFTDYGAGRFDLSRAHLAREYPCEHHRVVASPVPLLLVCKKWLRVATPLLYEAVVIRTHTQLHALALALCATDSPAYLGAFVRRLRFEACVAPFLDRVVRRTPNVHTLLIGLDVNTENGFHTFPYPSAGVREALKSLRVKRLMLKREKYAKNGRVAEMIWLLEGAIKRWNSLVRAVAILSEVLALIEYRRQVRVDFSNYFTLEKGLAGALSRSQSLQYISVYDCCVNCDLSECVQRSALRIVTENPHLKALLCRGESPKEIAERYPGRIADLLLHDPGVFIPVHGRHQDANAYSYCSAKARSHLGIPRPVCDVD